MRRPQALVACIIASVFQIVSAYLSTFAPTYDPVTTAISGGMCKMPLTVKRGDVTVFSSRDNYGHTFTRIINLDGAEDSYMDMGREIAFGCKSRAGSAQCDAPTVLTVTARILVAEPRHWARIFEISDGPNTDMYLFGQHASTGRLAFVSRNNAASSTPVVIAASNTPLPEYFVDVQLVLEHTSLGASGLQVSIYVEQELVASGVAHSIPYAKRSINFIGKSSYAQDGNWLGGIANLAFFESRIGVVDHLSSIEDHYPLWSIADVPNFQPIWRGSVRPTTSTSLPGSLGFARTVADFTGGYIDLGPNLQHSFFPEVKAPYNSPSVLLEGQLSFAAYILVREHGNWARIVELGNGPEGKAIVWFGFQESSGRLRVEVQETFETWRAASFSISAPDPLPTGRWIHVAATVMGYEPTQRNLQDYNGGNFALARIYQDGVQVASGDVLYPFGVSRSMSYIGRNSYDGTQPFRGQMASFEIYDIALCPEHVGHLSSAAATSSLVERGWVPEPAYSLQLCQRTALPAADPSRPPPVCSTQYDPYPQYVPATSSSSAPPMPTTSSSSSALPSTSSSSTTMEPTTPIATTTPAPDDACAVQGLAASEPAGWRQGPSGLPGDCECAIPGQEGNATAECGCPAAAYWDSAAGACVCHSHHQRYEPSSRECRCPEPACTADMKASCFPAAACHLGPRDYWCMCPEGFIGDGKGPLGCRPAPPPASTQPSPPSTSDPQAPSAPASTPEPHTSTPETPSTSSPATSPPPSEGPPSIMGIPVPDAPVCGEVLAAGRGCDLWVRNQLVLATGDVQGKVCVGGSFSATEGLSLATAIADVPAGACPAEGPFEYTLVVGGDVRWQSGRRFRGAYCVGGAILDRPPPAADPMGAPACAGNRDSGCTDVIDFEADHQQLLATSDALWAAPAGFHRSVAAVEGGQITLSLNASYSRHAVELDAALFEGWKAWGLRAVVVAGTASEIELVVVNLVGVPVTGLTIAKVFDVDVALRRRVLFNYPGQFPVRLQTPVYASLLLPRAALAGDSSAYVDGQVFVDSYVTTSPASVNVNHHPLRSVDHCVHGSDEPLALFAREAEALASAQTAGVAVAEQSSGQGQSVSSWVAGLAGLVGLLVGLVVGVGATRAAGGSRRGAGEEAAAVEAGKVLFTNLHGQQPRSAQGEDSVDADIRFQQPGAAVEEGLTPRFMRTVSGAVQRVRKASRFSVLSGSSFRAGGDGGFAKLKEEEARVLAHERT